MAPTKAPDPLTIAVRDAVRADDAARVEELLRVHQHLKEVRYGGLTWLHEAIQAKRHRVAELLLELGLDVNAGLVHSPWSTPLFFAIVEDDPKMVELLLSNGANPNIEKVDLLMQACTERKQHSIEVVKLLDQYGAELHRVHINGKVTLNPLSRAKLAGKQDVVDYLRSRGCVMPDEMPRPTDFAKQAGQSDDDQSIADEIVAHFAEHFGPVDPRALIEIVPTEPAITIHAIPAGNGRKHVTLFTTGLSAQAMNVPPAAMKTYVEDFRFAELFIQLPADWKYMDIADPNWGWPVHWLRSMAQFPYQNDSWLNGPYSIVSNGDPSESLAPNTRFDSLLMLCETRFQVRDGRTIQLYRLLPLYPEERELEAREDIGALFRRFDQLSLPWVVDLQRRNAAQ